MTQLRTLVMFVCALALAAASYAQGQATLSGVVVDPLGDVVPGATVTLLRDGQQVANTTSGGAGEFSFANLAADRYQVRVELAGFEPRTTDAVFVDSGQRAPLRVGLQLGPLQQDVVVTASATAVLEGETGAPVTVIDSTTLEVLNKPDVTEALRLVPGTSVIQTGQRGSPASIFIRGGDADFNKVLIDGVPANDIGGAFDFGQLTVTSVERIEVLRQSNSVLYGSDALGGVISLTTRRGRTRIPELSYSIDGGNLGAFNNALSFGGAVRRFDYFAQFGQFETDNNVPNGDYRNRTFGSRVGVALGRGTDLSATLRLLDSDLGNPNGILLYGIADDARSERSDRYVTVTAQSQWSNRVQSVVRYGNVAQEFTFLDPAPTGEAFDPFGFGANYLGNPVTITAANGTSVTGRAILNFGGTFPSEFFSRTTRQLISGQGTLQATTDWAISAGGRFERESAFEAPQDSEASATRNNGGVFVEGRGALASRVHLTAGLGYERNEAFGDAVTPRVSVAAYLREPVAGPVGETKLVVNAGTGIKAPNLFQESSSLFALVPVTAGGAAIDPIGPERSRNFDVGIEQAFADGRARVRVSYFDNDFRDLIEFVSNTVLPQLGVAPDVAAATGFGANVNSSSFTARGLETTAELAVGQSVRVSGSYTLLDAEVSESLSGGALAPATNPAFPGVQIGAFAPLVGARPFRRPTHSGTVMLSYVGERLQLALSGYLSGARDDSTFLSDAFFGNSLLLPNEDLDPAFQKWDLSAGYQVHPRLRGYASIENLLDKDYAASFGFPSLPLTARVGVSVRLGGDR